MIDLLVLQREKDSRLRQLLSITEFDDIQDGISIYVL